MHGYLALLRGINVGGNNVIKKDELQQCFKDLGYTNVRTYIQSGNVLFTTNVKDAKKITNTLQKELSSRFSYSAQVLVIPYKDYKKIMNSVPKGWGSVDTQKHNILFLLDDISPKSLLKELSDYNKTTETITPGPDVLFWSVSTKNVLKSTWIELPKKKIYKQMTIRNSNTAYKLLELFEEMMR